MALNKNTLKSNIKTAYTHSTDVNVFASNFAAAINTYLAGAVYNAGALVYASTVAPSMFVLPTVGNAATAALKLSDGVQSYWGGVVAGINGVPVAGGNSVISGTINASAVSSTLTPLLTAIFLDVNNNSTLDSKVAEITNAIETAVKTVTTTHTELMPGSPPYPSGPIVGAIS